MGYLSLDGYETEFDDRTLAHIHVVIINQLRSGHSFAMSWKDTESSGSGRSSVWLHPASNIRFHFSGSRAPVLNRDWLRELAECAESSRGLVIGAEPEPAVRPEPTRSAEAGVEVAPARELTSA
jgi:hypothetical protein